MTKPNLEKIIYDKSKLKDYCLLIKLVQKNNEMENLI